MPISDDVKVNQLREYQLVFDRAKIGIVVLRDRVIQRCNRRFEQIFGYGPGELVGKSTRVYYPSDEAWTEMGLRVNAMLADTRGFSSEDLYRRRDGSPIWCQVIGSLINPDKPDDGFICFYDDVSERKGAQDALQALLREQTLILQRAPTGIVFIRDRVILRCNPRFEAIFGYPPGALIGQSTRVLFADEQAWLDKGARAYGVIEHAGAIEADLWVTTTGTDADWVVKVVDVFPENAEDPQPNPKGVRMGGYQALVRANVMRGKFRSSFEKPEPFKAGEPTRVRFSLPDVLHTFRAGHRIMVHVQSTWFPLVDRNPQRFLDIYQAKDSDFQTETHRILRTPERASSLRVNVLRGRLPANAGPANTGR